MNILKTVLKNSPYALGVVTLILTVVSTGCQPTATYRGQDLTRPQLVAQVQSDISKVEIKAKSAENIYETQVAELQAEIDSINAESEIAAAEIERKELVISKGFDVALNTAVTIASGGTVNTASTIQTGLGLAGLLFGIGGTASAVGAGRRRKESDASLEDVVTAIEKAKDDDGSVNFKDPATKTKLDANMSNATIKRVAAIRNA